MERITHGQGVPNTCHLLKYHKNFKMGGVSIIKADLKIQALEKLSEVLDLLVPDEPDKNSDLPESCELLSVTECTELIHGLTVHALRRLIACGEIPSFRTGSGRGSKILVPKSELLLYFNKLKPQN